MTCRWVEKRLESFANGQLNSEDRMLVEQHLADCTACAKAHRFSADLGDRLGVQARLDPAFKFRMERELDEIESRSKWSAGWRLRGIEIMKKTVWPVAAAMVAVGSYVVMFPQGALATAVRGGLDDVKTVAGQEVVKQDKREIVIHAGDDEKGGVFQFLGEGMGNLSESELKLLSGIQLMFSVTKTNDQPEVTEWKVNFDQKKYRSVKKNATTTVIEPIGEKTLRVVVTTDPSGKDLKSVDYQKLEDGKWVSFMKNDPSNSLNIIGGSIDIEGELPQIGPDDMVNVEKALKIIDGKVIDGAIDVSALGKNGEGVVIIVENINGETKVDIKFDDKKFQEELDLAKRERRLYPNDKPNERIVIKLDKDGIPIEINKEKKVDGKWTVIKKSKFGVKVVEGVEGSAQVESISL